MILEHIAQYADAVIKAGAVFEPDLLFYGNLDMV